MMRSNATTVAVPSRWQAAFNEMLQYPGARAAFQTLCAEGLNAQRLAAGVLGMRPAKALRERRLFVDRSRCRRLATKLAVLADEFADPDVIAWCGLRQKPKTMTGYHTPIIIDLVGKTARKSFEHFAPSRLRPHSDEDFDVMILRKQLRAGARELQNLGDAEKPIFWGVEVNDEKLRRLMDDVKTYTGKSHYKEIALLCEAATPGHPSFDPDALKQRAHRRRNITARFWVPKCY
jgi:hypothetical protein